MSRPDWAPSDIDIEMPSVARIYDYNLGGSHNFAIDRAVAKKINEAMPDLPAANRANRSFLRRVVRFLAGAGIRQYLDLGSGIPTVGNVHEIARAEAPESRVVYVDVDAVAAAHSRAILAGEDGIGVVQADLRDPAAILSHPEVLRHIDFTQPVGLLVVAVLHFVLDEDDPCAILASYRDALAPGSYLAMSHATGEGTAGDQAQAVARVSSRAAIQTRLRDRSQVSQMFSGFRLMEPGLVYTPQWRPEAPDDQDEFAGEPQRSATLAAVGVRM
jgi:S-adenosyl methyltransferase